MALIHGGNPFDMAQLSAIEINRLREQRRKLREALEAAVECGMVPNSTANDGGASRYSRQVVVADMIRAALKETDNG